MASIFTKLREWLSPSGGGSSGGGSTTQPKPRPRPKPESLHPHVSAFGKHPAWADHIHDAEIPVPTEAIKELRTILYNEGIRRLIDSGEFTRLEEQGVAIPYEHWIVWRGRRGFVVANVWASRDQVGRSRYPMVACCQCDGLAPIDLWRVAQPILSQMHKACVSTDTQAGVLAAMDAARQQLPAAVRTILARPPSGVVQVNGGTKAGAAAAGAGTAVGGVTLPKRSAVQRLMNHPDMGPGGRRILHLLYTFSEWIDGSRDSRDSSGSRVARADQARAPLCADTPLEAVPLWLDFVQRVAGESAPMALLVPESQRWLDVFVGVPSPLQMKYLRVGEQSMPLTTEADEEFSPEFLELARTFLARSGATFPDPAAADAPPAAAGPGPQAAPPAEAPTRADAPDPDGPKAGGAAPDRQGPAGRGTAASSPPRTLAEKVREAAAAAGQRRTEAEAEDGPGGPPTTGGLRPAETPPTDQSGLTAHTPPLTPTGATTPPTTSHSPRPLGTPGAQAPAEEAGDRQPLRAEAPVSPARPEP